ncbi:MAG: inorganic phosphate transporter family protein [Methanobacteriaceae archaeon]|nr:inorganic phosphate transporter family protein [Methanobacteriaceae archaeon]
MDWLLIIGVIISFYMAFNIAANDIGNSIGTAVGSGSLNMRKALIIGAFFMFIGALYLGTNVIRTIGSGIIGADVLTPGGSLIILLSAAIWISFTLLKKIPISGSDAIVSAVFGYGLAAAGPTYINFQILGFIVLSWILSPLIGLAAGFGLYYILRRAVILKINSVGLKDRLEKIFSYFQIGSSSFAALNVGAIDIAAATGVIYYSFGTSIGVDIKFIGAIGLVLGVLLAGGRITSTIGKRITELVPTRGFSAQISMASVVYIFALLGMPISPTQTLVGSVIGVGMARGTDTVKMDVIKHIATTWIITIPACIALSATIYLVVSTIFKGLI